MSDRKSVTGDAPVLEARGLRKSFLSGRETLHILEGVDLSIRPGESAAILGQSGAGKTTLLQLLGGLDAPTSGSVLWNGRDVARMGEKERGVQRNHNLGFIYQFHHLLPEFTALENVAMPALIRGLGVEEAEARAVDLLDQVGLLRRALHKPSELSGGEKQRVAVARALSAEPRCILGDEPTGSLDRENAERCFAILLEVTRSSRTALITVTHDVSRAELLDQQYQLHEGRLEAHKG